MTKRHARPAIVQVTPSRIIEGLHYQGIVAFECTGPNKACKGHAAAGRTWHVIPPHPLNEGAASHLVMPSYHYATLEEGVHAIEEAQRTAHTVSSDEEWLRLEADHSIPFRIRPGMNHPTRR